jgi:hypothetical protein
MANDPGPHLVGLLEPGERVPWSGRPHSPNFRSEVWAAFAFGLLLLVPTLIPILTFVMLVREIVVKCEGKLLPGLPSVRIAAAVFGNVARKCLATPGRRGGWRRQFTRSRTGG